MAMAGVARSTRRPRADPIGSVRLSASNQVGQSLGRGFFNHFPAIIAAFPTALSDIVKETTEHLGEAAQADAPIQRHPRKGDPAPGTLKASKKTRYAKRRGSDLVITGRVDFKAKDRRGHKYARPVETGRHDGGRSGSAAAQPFLVPSVIDERPLFVGRLQHLESRLPR